jgi:hypothetical protein
VRANRRRPQVHETRRDGQALGQARANDPVPRQLVGALGLNGVVVCSEQGRRRQIRRIPPVVGWRSLLLPYLASTSTSCRGQSTTTSGSDRHLTSSPSSSLMRTSPAATLAASAPATGCPHKSSASGWPSCGSPIKGAYAQGIGQGAHDGPRDRVLAGGRAELFPLLRSVPDASRAGKRSLQAGADLQRHVELRSARDQDARLGTGRVAERGAAVVAAESAVAEVGGHLADEL